MSGIGKRKLSDPCTDGFAIVPADQDLAQTAIGLFIGTGGDLAVTTYKGTVLTFKNVTSGSIIPIIVNRVAAATTAADIIGLL
jgi:hypothetical protein